MTRTATKHGRRADDAAPDRGCSVWERCTSCPWSQCIAELPASEHTAFVHALRLVRRYLPAADGTIG